MNTQDNRGPGLLLTLPTELSSREARLSPFAWYRAQRNAAPVQYDPTRNAWDVWAYASVQKVLQNPTLFSSQRQAIAGREPGPASILSLDPPRHTKLRALVNKAFVPRTVETLLPRIKTITDQLLSTIDHPESFDVVKHLAYPLPVTVIAELLGVPQEDQAFFKETSDILVRGVEDPQNIEHLRNQKLEARMRLGLYFRDILQARRQHPADDLISQLVQAEIDGEHLSEMELLGFCIVLLAAGHETTTNLITNAVRALTEDPGRWHWLVQNPEALSSTIEEVLRFYSPVQATNRIVTQKTQWQGCPLEPGQQMIVWLGSANRDPSVFANPDTFIATRHPNPHVGFGYGIHFCLGAALARAEAHIALTGMLQRFPNLQAIGSQQLSPIISGFVYGVESYQVKGTA